MFRMENWSLFLESKHESIHQQLWWGASRNVTLYGKLKPEIRWPMGRFQHQNGDRKQQTRRLIKLKTEDDMSKMLVMSCSGIIASCAPREAVGW